MMNQTYFRLDCFQKTIIFWSIDSYIYPFNFQKFILKLFLRLLRKFWRVIFLFQAAIRDLVGPGVLL